MLRRSTIVMFVVVVALTVGTMFVLEMLYGGEKVVEDNDGPTVEEVFSSNASTALTVSDAGDSMSSEEAALRAAARAAAEGVARDVAREAAEAALEERERERQHGAAIRIRSQRRRRVDGQPSGFESSCDRRRIAAAVRSLGQQLLAVEHVHA